LAVGAPVGQETILPNALADTGGEPLAVQARLFGISGLLPVELSRSQAGADNYVRRVWDLWWRERDEFCDCILPRVPWRSHGLRPANHPQRRLALASCGHRESVLRLAAWAAQRLAPAGPARLDFAKSTAQKQ